MENYSRVLVGETNKQRANLSHLFKSTNPAWDSASEYSTKLHNQAPLIKPVHDAYHPDVVAMETGWTKGERKPNVVVHGPPETLQMITSVNPKVPFKAIHMTLESDTGKPRSVTDQISDDHSPSFRIPHPIMPVSPVDTDGLVRPRKQELNSQWHLLQEDTPKKTRYDHADKPTGFQTKAGWTAALLAMLLVFPAMDMI